MNKHYAFIISLLTLPVLLMGALDRSTIATDSATTSKIITKPTTVPQRAGTRVSAPDISAHNEQYDPTGKAYPPCPGDPSNPTFPRTPICPNINGWPSNLPFDPNEIWTGGGSTYSTKAGVTDTDVYLNKDVYCPDICVVTRYTATPPPKSVDGLVAIDSTDFKEAHCPAGYIQVTDFNKQPAIVPLEIPNIIYGPFATTKELNKYKNNPDIYDCSVYVHPTDPSKPHFTPISSNRNLADNYSNPDTYCTTESQDGGQKGTDTTKLYNTQMTIDGKIGEWISAWTWTPFDNNPSSCSTTNIFACTGLNSFIIGTGCSNPIGSGVTHHDKYYHYYMWVRCRAKKLGGYFYTESFQPASHLCTRVKPVWEH